MLVGSTLAPWQRLIAACFSLWSVSPRTSPRASPASTRVFFRCFLEAFFCRFFLPIPVDGASLRMGGRCESMNRSRRIATIAYQRRALWLVTQIVPICTAQKSATFIIRVRVTVQVQLITEIHCQSFPRVQQVFQMMESIIKAEARGNTAGRFRSAVSHGRDQRAFVTGHIVWLRFIMHHDPRAHTNTDTHCVRISLVSNAALQTRGGRIFQSDAATNPSRDRSW